MSVKTTDFIGMFSEYERYQLVIGNHCVSGVKATMSDLNLMGSFLLDSEIAAVNGPVLLEFISWLRNDRKNGPGATNRKISSVKTYMRFLRFMDIDGAATVPAKELKRIRQPWQGPVNTLSPEGVKHLFDGVDRNSAHGFRDSTIYSLLYRLGLRVGEAHRLDVDDINFEQEAITVKGKGRKERTLALVGDLPDLLRQYLAVRQCCYRTRGQDALFLSQKGNRLAVRTIQENFAALVDRTGPHSIEKVTPHTLRHAFASHAVDGDCQLLVLQAVMGHASMSSTEIYSHPSRETLRKAVNDHIANEILSGLTALTIFRMRQQCAPP